MQGRLRTDRETVMNQRSEVDERLVTLNKAVEQKRNQLQKLRSGLPYLREEEIVSQIQNLEYQLRKNHYKPTEEKKIVLEIDRLNRSKKQLREYNVLKADCDGLRFNQREVRDRRDKIFRQRGEIKGLEDKNKKDMTSIRAELDEIKKTIDEAMAEKRLRVGEFRKQEMEYKHFLYERREEQRATRKKEKEEAEAEKKKEL